MQSVKKITMWFKSYERFHSLVIIGRTDSHNDLIADPRVVQSYWLPYCATPFTYVWLCITQRFCLFISFTVSVNLKRIFRDSHINKQLIFMLFSLLCFTVSRQRKLK